MEIIGPLIISSIAGFSTVIGSLIVFFKVKRVEEFITFCLSFSAAVMITISILDLIPISTFDIIYEIGFFKGILFSLLMFLLGILSITIINKQINKCKSNVKYDKNLYRVGILSMIALIVHNFPEGIATFMSAYKDIKLGIKLGLAIMMHNIPEGISIAVPLFYSTGSRSKGIIYTFISGIAEPLGAILAYIFFKNYITNFTISIVLLLVAGIMITLAINELLPEIIKYNKPKYYYLGLIVGSILVLISIIL